MSAADLQRKHAELEGAPDPFPSLAEPPVKARPAAPTNGHELDTDSPIAFPSLAPSAPAGNKAPVSAWSAPRIMATASKQAQFSDSFTIPLPDLSTAGRDNKPTTLGEVMKRVATQHKVKIEGSTNQRLRQTTFYLKADHQKDLEKAKRALLAGVSPMTSLVLNAPASTIPTLIGTKGATLNKIREQTGVKVDIPRRDTLAIPANGSHTPSRTTTPLPGSADEEEEPTVPVTITGPLPLAQEARDLLQEIISSRTWRGTQRVKEIPAHILPFLLPRRGVFLEAAGGAEVALQLNKDEGEITVTGDREAVERVVASIKSAKDYFTAEVTSLKLVLPKRQHRLLVGKGAEDIMAKSKCAVVVPSFEESSEEVNVYGRSGDIGNGVTAVMEKANSAYIHEFPLPGPITVSRQLLTYMTRVDFAKTISDANPGVAVYTPVGAAIAKAQVLNVDLVGEKPAVDAAVRQVSQLVGKLIGATKDVPIDWLVHRIINSHKNAKKLKGYHENQNVLVFFPPEEAEQSLVLLVYDPTSPSASPSPVEKAQKLEEVEKELLAMAKAAANVKTQTITVEKKWHETIIGYGGTTLNALIGEDKTLSIKLGADVGDASTEDVVMVRGIAEDVDRAVKEIEKMVLAAKNDEIDNSYSTEFEIGREFVPRIVGAQGAGVNKLRDQLGVKIDFADDHDDRDKEVTKKKKAPSGQKIKVKVTGRKENAEEAKRRIMSQADRFAEETLEVLKIPRHYHASLIGAGGRYAIRLQDKYDVKITFPRDNQEASGRDAPKPDEVYIRGPRKGVASAKSELLDAYEFEKESNNEIKFTVPTRSVARVLGRAGASINEIKNDTGAQIDIEKGSEANENTSVVIRGTKTAIAEAKAAILAIADQVHEETTDSLTIENKFHRSLIGPGGQGLKDLIGRCGGPTDPKAQAGLVRFPRQGETSDEVHLRGEPKLVAKLKVELEKAAATLRDRVVLGVAVPSSQHRALIGRGGQHLTELQNRTGAQIQFPGSRSYNLVGEPVNADELADVNPADLVKVSGSRAACEKAIQELKSQIKAPAAEAVTGTLEVPLKFHHAVTQQGNLFRSLRSFNVHVEQSASPKSPPVPARPTESSGAAAARIDDPDEGASVEAQWQVVANYQDAEDGDATWTFKANDQESLDKALQLTRDAVEHAKEMTHVGFLTLPDRSVFPRIVGAKGANVARLRAESKADITVSRDDNTIVIVGSESAIETAKDAILKMTTPRGRGRRD